MQVKQKVVFIVGPTAIGKTSLAVKLAARINGEIISCDSMQVYKNMRILSQAPSQSETKKIRYHLIKFLEPSKEFSVASFIKKARPLIKGIIARRRVPIVAGGSGLYVKGLIDGLFPSPKADAVFRKKMYDYAKRHGSAKLHAKLMKIDADAARLIHPNDIRRIVRALEVRHSTGKTMTELKNNTSGLGAIYDIRMFGLTAPREEIYSRIERRIDDMFRQGVVGEVSKLSKKKLSRTARAALGIKEITGYLGAAYDIEAAKELIKKNTRRFAKRQLTWFKADSRIRWIDVTRFTCAKAVKSIEKRIK